jgi:SNF2 family DNA or RNA helicase
MYQNQPVLPHFTQKCKPFAHQQECLELSWDKTAYALLLEMGCGKSKVVIDNIAALHIEKKINGVLIIAPKGVYLNWVKNEIPAHMPDEVDYYIHAWSSYQTQAYKLKQEQIMRPSPDAIDIFVMNIEALNGEKGMLAAIKFLENHDAMTIIDESTCIKNPQADRTKRAFTLAKLSKYRRIMTGTPITQSPLDLFSQFKFLNQGILEFSSFTAFRAYYAEQQLIRMGHRAFNKVIGYRNLDQLQRRIANHSYRKLKTECLDLPEKIYQTRHIELTEEQRKLYDRLKDEALIQMADDMVTVTSALTMIMRLQQITCGHMKLDSGVLVDIPNNRLPELLEIIEESQGKVIVWAHFRRDVEQIEAELRREYGRESVVTYYGGTSDEGRANALEQFDKNPACRFFVGTQGTGGRGLTLVQSWTTIYYSNGYNLEHRLQSEDRNHRIGQKHNVTIIDIVCNQTVDTRIVALLKAKKNLADLVLDSWRNLILEDVPY